MFPFFPFSCCNSPSYSAKDYKEQRLKFLKWLRDDLETRMSGINAAISTLEGQIERESNS